MKQNKIIKIILIIFFFVFTIFVVYKNILWKKYMKEDISQTIGKVESFEFGAKVNPWLKYSYKVKNKVYSGVYDILSKNYRDSLNYYYSIENKFFLVKYNKYHPSYSRIILTKPIADSLVPPDLYKSLHHYH